MKHSGFAVALATSFFALLPIAHAEIACTLEAKLCPDGVTYVGRDSNNNCEFSPCPTEASSKPNCSPIACWDGRSVPRCYNDELVNYPEDPCLIRGWEDVLEEFPTPVFKDVPVDHPYAMAIGTLRQNSIIRGYDDGTFKPDQPINRAEFTKIIMGTVVSLDENVNCDVNTLSYFFDNNQYSWQWFSPFICSALKHKVIEGIRVGDKMFFRPEKNITFVEAAKIIAVAYKLPVIQTDVWYEGYVRALEYQTAIPLSIMKFDQLITRGEMAEMMFRTGNHLYHEENRSYEDLLAMNNPPMETLMSVKVFLSLLEVNGSTSYIPVEIYMPYDKATIKASLEALFSLTADENGFYGKSKLHDALYLSDLHVASATVVDGVATVKLTGEYSIAGDMDGERFVQQIKRTVMQFSTMKSANITVNGTRLECIADLSGMCE